jgi:hypothetical protein
LSQAYQTYHAQVVFKNSALRTWQQIAAKTGQGLTGGTTPDETQARENYFDAKGQAEQALSNLYTTEGQFRRLLGLTVNDGRIIRPCDEPSVAEFIPDWHIAVAEAIARRPEIRRHKWNIKALELQLCASDNLVQPRLDFVAGGQVNAFGNRLISQQSTLNQPGSSAFASLAEANQTGWDIGFEASIPIGFRNAHSEKRNFELRLARARAALFEQELDVTHEVRNAFQSLDRAYAVARSTLNRRVAAAERVAAYKAQYELRGTTADPLLRAQQSLVLAQVAYDQALIQYNQAISDFYYRTGTILQESNISVAEDMWDSKAYSDALREAWARSHAAVNPFVKTEPAEFVVPPGRPTSVLPAVGTSLAAPILSPDNVPPNSGGTNPPAAPTPQPQAPARQPAHTAFLAPPSGPAGWPQSPMGGDSGVQQSAGFLPRTASIEPASFFAPELGDGASGRAGDGKNRIAAAAAAPALFEAPAPMPVSTVIAPAAQGQSTAWSMPQMGPAGPRPTSSSDEIRSSASDSFEMPVNQQPGK